MSSTDTSRPGPDATPTPVEAEQAAGPADQTVWVAPDSDRKRRLQAALADLDRAWGLAAGGGTMATTGRPDRIDTDAKPGTHRSPDPGDDVTSGASRGWQGEWPGPVRRSDGVSGSSSRSSTRSGSGSDTPPGTVPGDPISAEPARTVPMRPTSIPAAADPFGPRTVENRYALGRDVEGCLIAIDIAREGRRFAGRRAAGVLRAVADRLADRLPAGAQLHDDRDALAVLVPDADGLSTTRWMHRTLPDLLEDILAEDDMARLQLRSVVYGSEGPVGAQLLLRLDRPSGSGRTADQSLAGFEKTAWGGAAVTGHELLGQPARPAGASVGDSGNDGAPTGRHDATGRTPFRPHPSGVEPGNGVAIGSHVDLSAPVELGDPVEPSNHVDHGNHVEPGNPVEPGSGGRRHRPEPDATPPDPQPGVADIGDTEGLGLADLLAGALAAYRGI